MSGLNLCPAPLPGSTTTEATWLNRTVLMDTGRTGHTPSSHFAYKYHTAADSRRVIRRRFTLFTQRGRGGIYIWICTLSSYPDSKLSV